LRPISGVLALAALARDQGAAELYVPADNAAEAAAIEEVAVFAIRSLSQLVLLLSLASPLQPFVEEREENEPEQDIKSAVDLADILGQEQSKRALEIAAAGGHNLLLEGLPGSGKTLLAKAFCGILPVLTANESLEI